ncbi:putative mitochondrial ATPase [Talaromyces proteolyticus]|uniref:Mitochondrial ATPase n=1 Tax=Talaromyces proteolyticus TaxID=1131652 RepID=A0AAD4KI73_9EURO|nr:putative mitochondrial ATPase [Talaromyces proteolyticus]KAH8690889.1 putative mitochondrial ATPase [Talaromyces proteolyticus]
MNQSPVRVCSRCFRRVAVRQGRLCSHLRRSYSSRQIQIQYSTAHGGGSGPQRVASSRGPLGQDYKVRNVCVATQVRSLATQREDAGGPLWEYERRVEADLLRDDEHQRAIIQHLQNLHDALKSYTPPPVIHPSPDALHEHARTSFWSSIFSRTNSQQKNNLPENLPKGLYMYGDVGCGKTMLMDLFYDTMPANIKTKERIHFHNFMQGVHRQLHKIKKDRGSQFDALPMVAADIAESASVLCFDEFQCTDVADAMILRRLLELLMSHGVVMVTTSNRHPDDLYKNGIQREHFIPCINLLKTDLQVLNLNSDTDYRKIPRPPSGVYHHPLDQSATQHADKWFEYLGDPQHDPPHAATHEVWGREIQVPVASGRAARFTFQQLIGRATGAADYLELVRHYDAFVVTDVPGMTLRERDLARRFITFIDAVYESKAKLVLTCAVPLKNIFMSNAELSSSADPTTSDSGTNLPSDMRMLMDDLGLSMSALKSTSIFTGDEERFAFARALSRLAEMGSRQWVERGMGVGMDSVAGKEDREAWKKTRSRWSEDSM